MNDEIIFPTISVAVFAAAFAGSYFGIEGFRRWGLRNEIFDHPNERSSHERPIPRGAGVVLLLIGLVVFGLYSFIYISNPMWSYLAGALLIGIVSWLDDLYSIASIWRFAAHSLAAILLTLQLGYLSRLYIPIAGIDIDIGIYGSIITFFWIVWVVSAFNFIDGIDGMAGLQAVIAGFGWMIFGYVFGMNGVAFNSGIVAVTCIAFLFYNWQPARVFMGDTGSSYLGFAFAAAPLMAVYERPENAGKIALAGLVFVWIVFFDTVFTFIRRIGQRKQVWMPHREHLYQKMVISGNSHRFVSKIYGAAASIIIIAAILAFIYGGAAEFALVFCLFLSPIVIIIYGVKKKD